MEQFPLQPSFERIDTQMLVGRIREEGWENEEVKSTFQKWRSKNEDEATHINTPEATIMCNFKEAKLYVAAGLNEKALEILELLLDETPQGVISNESYNTILDLYEYITLGKPDLSDFKFGLN